MITVGCATLAIALLLYTYAGYPLAIGLLARLAARRRGAQFSDDSDSGGHDDRPTVLATRADLTQLLHGAPSRLATGWRAQLVGAPIQRLLAGEATIVLRDGGRRVELRDQ